MTPAARLTARLAGAVALGWIVIGLLWGAQNAMGATLRGGTPMPLSRALSMALIQTVPWIPITLAVIALTLRMPISRAQWVRPLVAHLLAAPVLAFAANVLVVLGFQWSAGQVAGPAALARAGALWATINFHVALLIYAAVLGITQGMLYYRGTRSRELHVARLEGQLAQARLQALNAQIRPHFLFNTLHTIGHLWRSGRHDDADAMLDHLGALFHRVQRSSASFEVPLGEELATVREYLAIEEARFPDRLRTTVHATSDAEACLVPPLILQPLVENAIRHGISPVSSAGRVDVSATRDNGRLRLVVRDDGPGITSVTPHPGSGTGLRNTRERLTQLYGAEGVLRIESAPEGGTVVTVEIPAGTEPHRVLGD